MAAKPQKTAPQEETEPVHAPEAQEPPPKKRGKLLLIVGLLVVVAAGAGGGFYFMQPAHSEAVAPAPKPPVFMPLEAFTVNLISDAAQMQFMQAGITLKLTEKATADLVKERLPEVRDRVLMVLSAKKGSEILSVAGKQKLAVEIADNIRKVIAPAPAAASAAASPAEPSDGAKKDGAEAAKPPVEVLFTSFIVQ